MLPGVSRGGLILILAPVIAIAYLTVAWDKFTFVSPLTQVYQLAAFAAKWAELALGLPFHFSATGWAAYQNNIIAHQYL